MHAVLVEELVSLYKLYFPVCPPLGNSSSASSSDDEIKEVFESCKQSMVPTRAAFPSRSSRDIQGQVFPQTVDCTTNRPLRVVPSGHHKPKFFAQMSATPSERPYLDFNKMQHSKRIPMVRISMSVGASYWPLQVQDINTVITTLLISGLGHVNN